MTLPVRGNIARKKNPSTLHALSSLEYDLLLASIDVFVGFS